MFKGYRIHQEQLANVARNLKELSVTRLPDPQPSVRSGKGRAKTKTGMTGRTASPRVRKTVWKTDTLKEPVKHLPADILYGTEAHGSMAPVNRCLRCGEDFPGTDFLYTKKTGLCISCWEAKVI